MSSKREPAVWSGDTGQQIPCFDMCQLTITLMFHFKNECECFIRVSKHEKIDESTRPQAKCFYCFRVLKLMDRASFQCFTGVSNHMHVTKLASFGWMITL